MIVSHSQHVELQVFFFLLLRFRRHYAVSIELEFEKWADLLDLSTLFIYWITIIMIIMMIIIVITQERILSCDNVNDDSSDDNNDNDEFNNSISNTLCLSPLRSNWDFRCVGFCGGRKTGEPEEKNLRARREPTTNSTIMKTMSAVNELWSQSSEASAYSLRQPCSPNH